MKTKPTLILAGIALLVLAGIAKLTMAGGPNEDWGDAPDGPYSTLAANTGPSHTAVGPILGTLRDIEGDGQPNTPATGDDLAGGADDEDGVLLTSPLVPGTMASVTVITSGTGPYVLNAWMDFNDDGDWADPGEQIFTDTGLAAGSNFLTFPVPAGPPIGRVYSRWRLNTTGGLTEIGPAADGEVEDYCHSPIHGQKWHDLNGNGKREANEPGLNGQVIQLYAADGTTLIATATTHEFEHDGFPGIDPFYEHGVYWMHAPAGYCIVREKPNVSFVQTFPANCGAKEYFLYVQCEQLGREPKPPICPPAFNWLETCPGPGLDEMFSAAQIIMEAPPGPPFNGQILTMFASGPTFVNRSAPMNLGPNGFIQTEMLQMDLAGHHPQVGRIHARAGSQLLPPPIPPTQGQILENGGDQFIVDSFFDVYFEIELPDFFEPTLQVMRNDWNGPGAHVETPITQIPPFGEEYVEEEVPLFAPAAFPGPTGPPNGFKIIKLVHKPIPGIDFGNATKPTVAAPNPLIVKLQKKIKRLKKRFKKAKRRGQRAKVRRLARKIRQLKRRLKRL